jgi:hypothetical protein
MEGEMQFTETDELIAWLMEGDPAIRWQTLRDLLERPAAEWQAERQNTLTSGWGARLLALQDPEGTWGRGIYSPKWISTTYTLLTLRQIGIPGNCPAARRGASLMLDDFMGSGVDGQTARRVAGMDRCIVGMALNLAVYFEMDAERIQVMLDNLLDQRLPDGAWNCRLGRDKPDPRHSSFHTTFNVLEGLRDAIELSATPPRPELLQAEADTLEFMLRHRLFKSHRTGEEINPVFTMLSFPYRWHYDVLRGLDYFARLGARRDPRLQDAIDLLNVRRRSDGRWPVQHKYAGLVFFDMEKTGGPSRWNTLRALRVLKWWNS